MGSRKDILKTLGIPEYPWSSDDDEPPSDPRPPPIQPRPSGQQATTSTSSPGTPARSHVQARELFLSLLNQTGPRNGSAPGTSTGNNRFYRSDDIPLAYLSRTTHTPAPELRERPGGRGDLDIQRVLAFKRLTKNINTGRYSRYAAPRGNSRPGSVVPSESNSGSVRLPYFRRVNRNSATNNIPGSARQIVVDLNHQHMRSERRNRRTHSTEVQISDNEADDTEQPASASRTASAASTAVVTDEPPVIPENEAELQAASNNTSGTSISLEEEIVEIVDEHTTVGVDMDLIDRARAVIPSSSDPNLASTSRPDEVDAPEMEQNHGVKRKRREYNLADSRGGYSNRPNACIRCIDNEVVYKQTTADDKPTDPFTVKDFNQSLLRLLECPVCLEWMEPPMSQCRRGHLVCNRCRARLASCPVCRTTFSSVRNRAMEGVAEMLRYPCRHGCGREVRLRRRTPHEASCASRKYLCPAPLCVDRLPLPRSQLALHFHAKHLHMVKLGPRHHFGIKVNNEAHDNWLIMALDEFFHMKVDVDIRSWGVIVYVAYIGPKCNAMDFAYEVTIDGQHNSRKMLYKRATHSDLESSSLNVSRQDCFHLTLDQALNFIRFKNRHCDAEKFLEFHVEISKVDPPPSRDDSDS